MAITTCTALLLKNQITWVIVIQGIVLTMTKDTICTKFIVEVCKISTTCKKFLI